MGVPWARMAGRRAERGRGGLGPKGHWAYDDS